ncbi:MAG UNVERIFIED_CONTAM: hypothetical protein LVT10_16110 [Anaerolineae bacterium]|jgi:hypothetical protein
MTRVAGVPQVLISQSSDRAALREAIQNAQGSVESADWNAALTFSNRVSVAGSETFVGSSSGDGAGGECATCPLSSGEDGLLARWGGSMITWASPPLPPVPKRMPPRNSSPNSLTLAMPQLEVVFDLQVDGAFFTAERYTLAPKPRFRSPVPTSPIATPPFRAALTPVSSSTTPDYLSADNVAYAVQEPSLC